MGVCFRRSGMLWPMFFLALVFLGNTFSILKSVVLLSAVVLFDRESVKKCLDNNFFGIFIFSVSYVAISLVDSHLKSEVNFALLFMPACLYAGGKWLGCKVPSSGVLGWALLGLGLLLASMALVGVLLDVANNGFVGGSRSVEVPGTGGVEVSATVLGGTLIILASFGGALFAPSESVNILFRPFVAVLYVVALFVAMRLGSRTLLIIGVASLVLGLILNGRRIGIVKTLLILFGFSFFIYFFMSYLEGVLDIFSYFQDRLDDEEYGTATAGGRTEKWLNSLELLVNSPLGWGVGINGFSHNLWLDSARNGGWPSFFILMVLTVMSLRDFLATIKCNAKDALYKTLVRCIGFGFLLLFFVEPILDGFIYVFSAYCCFWGVVTAFRPSKDGSRAQTSV